MNIPREYLAAYAVSNLVALALLALAFWRPRWVRLATIAIFAWASAVNTRIALFHPEDYQGFADLAVLTVYRDFITGWFARHTAAMLLPIAAGQLAIALLLLPNWRRWRRLSVGGAALFLIAISPLGVGSAFPFSVIYIVALLVMEPGLGRAERSRLSLSRDMTYAAEQRLG